MKHLTILFFLFLSASTFAQTGIGTTTPHASAQLEVSSTTKGFLPPRLTTIQRNAIANPATGLQIYNITTNTLEYKTVSGWVSLISNPNGVNSGEMQYWDGSAWVVIPSSTNDGAILSVVGGIPTWVAAPDAPIIGNATGGDTQARVSFTAPASSGSAAIVAFPVSSGSGGIRATGISSPIIVTGLTNGTAYTFTVTAINSFGTGVASAASYPVTPYQVTSVTSPTGQIWMDRNLGATQVATSSKDVYAYGDLYQWGRAADGHQINTSGTTTVQSSLTRPGTTFITGSENWYNGPNPDNLWQEVNGINNPCPIGYRLPTETEWEAERATWSSNDLAGAFASLLKLPMAGGRSSSSGSLLNVGDVGDYWSSTVSSTNSRYLRFRSGGALMNARNRAYGHAVRCLKD
jgi:uncharacterized protein (TIGR02145 family)